MTGSRFSGVHGRVGPDQFNPPTSTLSAAAVVVTVPIIVIVLLFQRKIVAGLTSGAVKG